MIEIKHLSKSYDKTQALINVDLTLQSGKIIGLLGPNGSGKTTLIKILNGLLRDYQGEVLIDGQPIGAHSKGLISYLPDVNYFANWMNGELAVKLFKDMYEDFDELRFRELMGKLKLDTKQSMRKMSKG
jgi:ABC-2 type transport system ATP-binding protein